MAEKVDLNELLILIANNDESALSILFEETKGKFYYIASKYLVNQMYVEDVLSEAYLKIYTKASKYNPKFDAFAWMYEIVKNTAIDFNRKFSKEKYITFDERLIKIEEPEMSEILYFALRELNEEEYQVAYLKIWENRTLEAIAEEMGGNVSQVFRIYQSVLTKLRAALVGTELKQ